MKRKGSALRQHSSGTGGGPALADILTPMEERILSLMGVQNVLGIENVRIEVDVCFCFIFFYTCSFYSFEFLLYNMQYCW